MKKKLFALLNRMALLSWLKKKKVQLTMNLCKQNRKILKLINKAILK